MVTLRSKRKFAFHNKENCKEHPRSNLAQNSIVPRSQEDYNAQVSEKNAGGLTEVFSQDYSNTESCFLRALYCLEDFHLSPLNQGHSRTAPETSQHTLRTNQGTNEDDSQSDPHPEAGVSQGQTANYSTDDIYDRNVQFFYIK